MLYVGVGFGIVLVGRVGEVQEVMVGSHGRERLVVVGYARRSREGSPE